MHSISILTEMEYRMKMQLRLKFIIKRITVPYIGFFGFIYVKILASCGV